MSGPFPQVTHGFETSKLGPMRSSYTDPGPDNFVFTTWHTDIFRMS